jgi:hypothetical protein
VPYTVTVLSMVNALRCCGLRSHLAEADDDRERRWLTPAARGSGHRSGVGRGLDHVALAAAGAGMADLALQAAALEDTPFDPRATYGADTASLATHLARAQRIGAGPDAVHPAWVSFLGDFPGRLEEEDVQWLDLLWAARGIHVVLGGQPVDQVSATLHREVWG